MSLPKRDPIQGVREVLDLIKKIICVMLFNYHLHTMKVFCPCWTGHLLHLYCIYLLLWY